MIQVITSSNEQTNLDNDTSGVTGQANENQIDNEQAITMEVMKTK